MTFAPFALQKQWHKSFIKSQCIIYRPLSLLHSQQKISQLKQILSLKHICNCCGSLQLYLCLPYSQYTYFELGICKRCSSGRHHQHCHIPGQNCLTVVSPFQAGSLVISVTRSYPQVRDKNLPSGSRQVLINNSKYFIVLLLKILQTPPLSTLCLKKLGNWCLEVMVITCLTDQYCFAMS